MAGPDDLHDAAVEYLDACVAALDALTTAGAPEIRFVAHGLPALNCCPMLAVNVGSAGVAGTQSDAALGAGHRITLTGIVETITLTATIVRCTGTPAAGDGQPYSPAEENAIAAETNRDAWAIVNWLQARKLDETLFPPLQRELAVGTAVARTVEGFCAGWLIPVQVTLDGFHAAAT